MAVEWNFMSEPSKEEIAQAILADAYSEYNTWVDYIKRVDPKNIPLGALYRSRGGRWYKLVERKYDGS